MQTDALVTPVRIEFVIPGCPIPKARARRTRSGHWYTPQKSRLWERAVGVAALGAKVQMMMDGITWPLAKETRYRVDCVFFMPDRRTRDGDNILKSIQDGAERVLWITDRQCIEGSYVTRYDKENPRAEVVATILTRG